MYSRPLSPFRLGAVATALELAGFKRVRWVRKAHHFKAGEQYGVPCLWCGAEAALVAEELLRDTCAPSARVVSTKVTAQVVRMKARQ